MLKKSLMFFSVLFIIGAFILGCSNPTTGPAGEAGPAAPGGNTGGSNNSGGGGGDDTYTFAATVSSAELEVTFAKYTKVVLFVPALTPVDVAGKIPAGKTLVVRSPVSVANSETLTLDGGTLVIEENGGQLKAGVSGVGTLALTKGTVQVDGFLEAPVTFFATAAANSDVKIEYGDTGGAVLDSADTAANVDAIFDAGVNTIVWPTTSFNATAVAGLTNWTGDKTLILSGANTVSATLDVSGKGNLEIADTLTLGAYTFTSGGKVTVSKDGSIVLSDTASTLVGGITVEGTLKVSASSPLTNPIPTGVDLSKATLVSDNASASVGLPASTTIGTIDLAETLTITGATTLNIGTLKATAATTLTLPAAAVTVGTIDVAEDGVIAGTPTSLAITTIAPSVGSKTLTLPAGMVTVTAIVTDTSKALTIAGTSTTTLKPAAISGDGELSLGASDLLLDGNITIASSATLKTNNTLDNFGGSPYTQLAKISGGTVDVGSAVVTPVATTTINTVLTTTGVVTFPIGSLVVGPGGKILAGSLLEFGPGTYTATTGTFETDGGAIKTSTNSATLALGTSGITLKADASVSTTGTFTAANKVVVFNGTGAGSITIPGDSSAGSLTIGATAELALGDGTVYLGFDTAGGILTVGATGAKISGFVSAGSTIASTGNLTAAISGNYNSGVALAYSNNPTYASNTVTGGSGAEDALFTGLTTNGGAVTKNLAIGQ
jgi:hypothetical protein